MFVRVYSKNGAKVHYMDYMAKDFARKDANYLIFYRAGARGGNLNRA